MQGEITAKGTFEILTVATGIGLPVWSQVAPLALLDRHLESPDPGKTGSERWKLDHGRHRENSDGHRSRSDVDRLWLFDLGIAERIQRSI